MESDPRILELEGGGSCRQWHTGAGRCTLEKRVASAFTDSSPSRFSRMSQNPSEEIFDVVDDRDRVVGQAPRSEVHAKKLLHRAAHIFVFNSAGELLIHQRSATKDEYPHRYTSSASGHLAAGESYASAAARELQEELGLVSPLRYLTTWPAGPDTAYEHSALFRTQTDQTPVFDPDEIAGGAYLELDQIAAMIAESPERFTPPFRVLFEWYCREQTL